MEGQRVLRNAERFGHRSGGQAGGARHHERAEHLKAHRLRQSPQRFHDVDLIHLLLSRNFIPVIMPIGVGADGTAYHINSDLLAGRLARTLEAEKLILMTNVPGVRDRAGRLAYILTASEADALLRDGIIEGGMRPRVTAALRAVREGVRSVHIIDGGVPSALLLEVLTAEGVGTAVRADTGPHFLDDSRGYLFAE